MPKKITAKGSKQKALPGMEDRILKDLEDLAEQYAEIRDERMALNKQEVDLKDSLLAAMKRHGKETYKRDGIEINIVHEEENVKVRVKKEKEEADAE